MCLGDSWLCAVFFSQNHKNIENSHQNHPYS
jgi:hypothetical protein